MFITSFSVCPWQAFEPCVIFVGKAKRLLLSEAAEMSSTRVGSGLTHKMERLARDKL